MVYIVVYSLINHPENLVCLGGIVLFLVAMFVTSTNRRKVTRYMYSLTVQGTRYVCKGSKSYIGIHTLNCPKIFNGLCSRYCMYVHLKVRYVNKT